MQLIPFPSFPSMRVLPFTALTLLTSAALAQQPAQQAQPPAPAFPCRDNPDSRAFDFWIGEWDVKTSAGQPAGHSVVQKIAGDCGLLENWTARNGATGKSINGFNKSLGMWQQFWVGQGGAVTEYRESEWVGTTLAFRAKTTQPDGKVRIDRMSFTPLDSARVRQHGESSLDDGKTWQTTFDLIYHRR